MTRYTKKDVLSAFASCQRAATAAGLKGVSSWSLQIGNATYGYQFRIQGDHVSFDLTSQTRIAYEKITAMTRAFDEIYIQRLDESQ